MTHTETYLVLPDYAIKAVRGDTPDRRFTQSTVTSGAVTAMKWAGEKESADLLKRAMHWIMICAQINARSCASSRIRLYRKAESKKRVGKGFRRVEARKRLDYLRNGVSGKAATYASDADGIEEITDHPALDILARPNPLESGGAFAHARFLWKELCGNAFVQVVGDVDGLYLLSAAKTAIVPSRTEFVQGYRYGTAGDTKTIFKADEVDHYKHSPSPFSPYLGWGWVQAIIMDADRYSASTQSDLGMWLNSGRPDYMVMLAEGSNEDQAKQIRENISKRHRGPTKTNEFFIATGGVDIKPLSWAPKDLEGVASRADAKEIIHAAADVPMTFSELQNANKAGSQGGNRQYAMNALLPRLCRDADDLTSMLLPRYGVEDGTMWFAYDNPVPEDEVAETDRAVKLIDVGITTINDTLAELGYDQIDAAVGDVRRYHGVPLDSLANMGVTGMGETGNPTLEPKPGEPVPQATGGAATVQDTAMNGAQVASMLEVVNAVALGDLPAEAAKQVILIAFPTVTEDKVTAMLAGLEGFEPASVQREAAAAAAQAEQARAAMEAKPPEPKPTVPKRIDHSTVIFKGHDAFCERCGVRHKDAAMQNIDAAVPSFEAMIRRWFEAQFPPLVNSVKPDGSFAGLATNAGSKDALLAIIEPNISQLFRSGYNFGIGELGSNRGEAKPLGEALTQGVRKYIADYAGQTIQSVTETVDKQIRNALSEGIKAGEGIPELTTRVQDVATDLSRYGAERIARTETTDAYQIARIQSWKDSGEVWGKRWLLAPDACPFCVEAAKNYGVQPLDKPFFALGDSLTVDGVTMTFDYKAIQGGNLHPNDRCSIVMVLEAPT